MLQCIHWLDTFVWIQSKAMVEEVNEMIQISRLVFVHASRCSHKARAKIFDWFYHRQRPDSSLCLAKFVSFMYNVKPSLLMHSTGAGHVGGMRWDGILIDP